MMQPTSQKLWIQGLPLQLWDFGGSGPVVLCLHGYLDQGRSFTWLAQELAGQAHVLSLDWRGHGQSAWVGPGGSYHLLDHVKDLHLVCDALEQAGQPVDTLVGHSMGGNIALLWAGSCPGKIRRLLLLDAIGPPAEEAAEQPERLANLLRSLSRGPKDASVVKDEADAISRLLFSNPRLTRQGAERMARFALVPHEDEPQQFRFAFDPRVRGPTPNRWPEEMWRTLCTRLDCAVHLLRAEHGYAVCGEPTQSRLGCMSGAVEEVARGHGHHLHVDAPQVVADALRRLLQRRPDEANSALP